ncbi:NAD-specific glutamate dehydrogenase [compost metagenome]
MLRHSVSYSDEWQRDRCRKNAGQFFLSFLSCIFQTLYSRFILAQINTLIFLEFSNEVINDNLVKVIPAETVVPACCFNFEESITQFKDRYVESTATKVIDQDRLIFGFLKTVSKSCCRWLVHNTKNFKTRDFTRILGCLTLAVVEVSRNRDNSLSYRLSKVCFSISFQFLQNNCGNLLRREIFAINRFFVVRTNMSLDRDDCTVWIRDGLTLGCFTHHTLSIFLKTYHGRSCARTLRVRNNNGFAAFHNCYTRVSCSKVDTNNFTHKFISSLRMLCSICLCV